jgi:RNA polymerase sigma-70 factor (ECF subfamily)
MSASDAPSPVFATTHWSVIAAAQGGASPQAREALAVLCQSYWYPLYAFIRRQGQPAEEALDHTQEFFARLLEKDFLADVDRAKGRFRSFLLAACKHFLANERDRLRAQKRGGECALVSIDLPRAEERYRLEPAHNLTPEKLYERRWALTLLDQVLARLRAECTASEKGELFEQLKGFLAGRKAEASYHEAAEPLGMTEGAFKVAVHRLRRRYRELLQDEILRTVGNPDQVEEEIQHLFEALGPGRSSKSW